MCHAADLRRQLGAARDDFHYVPGHQGHFFNEAADALAKHGARVNVTAPCLSITEEALGFWLGRGALHLPWAALTLWRLLGDSTMPSLCSKDLGDDRFHAGMSHADLLCPFVPNGALAGPDVVTPPDQQFSMDLRLLSFNTLSLGACVEDDAGRGTGETGLHQRPARAALLASQLQELSISVAALQETRCPQGFTRIGGFLRFASGANRGQHGTELWFRDGGQVLFTRSSKWENAEFAEGKLNSCHTDPRRILVRYRHENFSILFCALHAPHRAHERELIKEWWEETAHLLAKHRRRDPVVIAGDLNCSLGSVPSKHVSTWAAEDEDLPGSCFHQLLSACECWAPCTFGACQVGPTATYTQKRNGRTCRPDFIAIPSSWGDAVVHTWVEHGVHVASAGIDHFATSASVQQFFAMPGKKSSQARPRIPAQIFTDPNFKEDISKALREAPVVPWAVSAHAHAALVVGHLQTAFCKLGGKREPRPTHAYLTEQTWQLQRRVTKMKRSLAQLQHQCRNSLLAFCLRMWRSPSASHLEAMPWSGGWADQALVSMILHMYHIRADSKRLRKACKQDRDRYVSRLADTLATCPSSEAHSALHKLLCHKRKKAYAPEPLPQVKDATGEVCADPVAVQQRWREYFAAMEAGTCMPAHELATELLNAESGQWPVPDCTHQLPCRPDLVRLMLTSKAGKAAGMDGLPNELLRSFAPECAEVLFPLLMKLVFRGTEAIGMKGGLAVWFHKGKGAKDACESYRQILLLPCFAKILHQAVRPAIREVFQTTTPTLQLGGKPGQNVCFGAHLVRAFLRYNSRLKRSCFVLFTDIATAFYAVVRQLIAVNPSDPPQARELSDGICQGLQLSPDDIAQLKLHAQEPSSLRQAGASPWLEAISDSIAANTWFMLRGDSTAVLTARGTRPGSSWADILFGMVVSRVLKARDAIEGADVSTRLEKPSVPWDGQKVLIPCPNTAGTLELGDLVWADDVATMRVCRSPYNLAPGLAVSAGSLCDSCAGFGFRLSFGPNKTASIVQPGGAGSRKAAQTLFGPNGHKGSIKALREHAQPISVPLVSCYRHLGVMQAPRGALVSEIKFRTAQAWAKFAEGRRKVFKATGVSVKRKAFILRSSVLPKLLYGSGSWPTLSLREQQAFGGALWGLYRAICGIPAVDAQNVHSCSVLALTGLPNVAVTLHCQRLLYLKTLVQSGPDDLWAAVRTDIAFLDAVVHALDWLFTWTHATSSLPDPKTGWECWKSFIADTPNRFKGLLLRAQGLEVCRQQVLGSLDGLYRFLRHLAPVLPDTHPRPQVCGEACIPCRRLFASRVAWAAHAARMHGYRNKAHLLGQSRLCRSCGRLYASVGRLRRHLLASQHCVERWGSFTPDSEDQHGDKPGHPQMPPVPTPGSSVASHHGTGKPCHLAQPLLEALCNLAEGDDSIVWEIVSDYVEPLQVLRETVRYWQSQHAGETWVQEAAENVLLLLDPEMIGEPDSAQYSKVNRHAFAKGLPPAWPDLPQFCVLPFPVGQRVNLEAPPPVILSPHSATSVRLRLGQAYGDWLEQACALLARSIVNAQTGEQGLYVSCEGLEASLGPASKWLRAAGFAFEPGGMRSCNFVSPEFTC